MQRFILRLSPRQSVVRFLSAACLSAGLFALPAARGADKEEGWVDLLEGNELSANWTTEGNWSVANGVVTLAPRPGESGWRRFNHYLWSKKQYEDFEVRFDYKIESGGNSGFYFRVADIADPAPAKVLEVQVFDSHAKGAEGRLNDHDSGGVIPGFPPTKNASKPAGEWNEMHVVSKEGKLTVRLNGEVVNEVDLAHQRIANRPAKGYIGFQDHGVPMALRNIKLREL